ncbi:hypothetical protein GCM10009863_26510 [Streptomyces axinellae]|uniref:Rv2525c-like glycoside hydrolase-like domain-containing protein n=2 Tax=Streptomyces axinellae TaxID=552788 RepID=A0ABP6CDW4_9ACTN
MIRRGTVLLAALAALFTSGVLPAAGSEAAPADPVTSHPPVPPSPRAVPPAPPSPGAASGTAASSAPRASRQPAAPPGAAVPSGPSRQAPPGSQRQPSSDNTPPAPGVPSQPGQSSQSGQPSQPAEPSEPRTLLDPAAPDAPEDPTAPGAPDVPGGQPSLIRGDPRSFGAEVYKGYAFDACQAPSAATMRAWKRASPFGAVGVYIGGRGRACPRQKHLTPEWVRGVHKLGWKLLPLYVGSQSPCVRAAHKRKVRMSTSGPYAQGKREGLDAVRQAKRFHMVRHSAVYLDMEAYSYRDKSCAATTLRFIQGWNSAVRAQGYVAGFYSSADSGVSHLEKARAAGARGLPTALWFARWNVPKSLDGERGINRRAWQPHRRIHQYTGNVKRTYGGHTAHIDQNLVDAPVAVVG